MLTHGFENYKMQKNKIKINISYFNTLKELFIDIHYIIVKNSQNNLTLVANFSKIIQDTF